MAVYAIGDVQGCFQALQQLLDTIAFHRDRDQLWFTGDLVNRGPQSLEVLRFVKDLGDRAVTVLGNHDLHLLAVAHGCGKPKAKDTLADVLAAPDRDALLTWLRHRPLLHYDEAYETLMVHAGLSPQWTLERAQGYAMAVEAALRDASYLTLLGHIENNAVGTWTATLGHWERLGYLINCFTNMRYCDVTGHLAFDEKGPPGTQTAPYLPWFMIPQRAHADLTIVFGHWSSLGYYAAPGIYALDSGCVWGQRLTALCLETKEQVSVSCSCGTGASGGAEK